MAAVSMIFVRINVPKLNYAVGLQYAVKKYWQGKMYLVCPTKPTVGRATALHAHYVPAPPLDLPNMRTVLGDALTDADVSYRTKLAPAADCSV